ncbi:hypothetical protein EGR_05709 [Echinococcus granulosus]|uniref:Uncharacterized protein n=1 Tax=Echinococcus granulosus TaxID=6210 RepID=W6UEI3_ECHGR|nr:hypothetical protein EGR_05709 [Echinococcus granulosus]EUB59458.1 hypothetical protein EGR_05709 [Echinococcus granulosus]
MAKCDCLPLKSAHISTRKSDWSSGEAQNSQSTCGARRGRLPSYLQHQGHAQSMASSASSSASSTRYNQIRLRRVSLNAENLVTQPKVIGRHLRRLREPVYSRKYSDRIFTHTHLSGIKSSPPDYHEVSGKTSGSTSSLGEDAGDFDFSDVHSSCLALNPTPNRRTSFLYRPDSSGDASSYSSRRPSVSCGDAVNL